MSVSRTFGVVGKGEDVSNALTATLKKKGQNISANEKLGQPLLAYQAVRFSLQEQYDPAQLHVDCRGEQRGRNEE